MKSLRKLKQKPEFHELNLQILLLKVNPQNEREKLVFILIDEMSLRKRRVLDKTSGSIIGYQDCGLNTTSIPASSALVLTVEITDL